MSQIYKSLASGPVPPAIATSYVTQNGTAVPAANILIVNAIDSSENNDNGIISKGGVVGTGTSNEVDIVLTNRITGSLTTANDTATTIITLSMGATPGTFYVFGSAQAFYPLGPASGSYSFSGGYRTDGATATEIGVREDFEDFEDIILEPVDVFISASGNNIILQVQGLAATSINWSAIMEFRKVN